MTRQDKRSLGHAVHREALGFAGGAAVDRPCRHPGDEGAGANAHEAYGEPAYARCCAYIGSRRHDRHQSVTVGDGVGLEGTSDRPRCRQIDDFRWGQGREAELVAGHGLVGIGGVAVDDLVVVGRVR